MKLLSFLATIFAATVSLTFVPQARACPIAWFADPLPGGGGETMFSIGLAGSRLYGGWVGPPRIRLESPLGTFADCTMWLPPLRIEPDGTIYGGQMAFFEHNTTEVLRIGFTYGHVDANGFGAGPATGGTVTYIFASGGIQCPPALSEPIQNGSFYFAFHNPIQGPNGPEYTASFRTWAPMAIDLNGDDAVDLSDLTVLLAHFGMTAGATHADGDLDGDRDVDLSDLAQLLAHFGAVCA